MVAGHNVNTEFVYWTRPENPDYLDAASIINGIHPGVEKFPAKVQDIRASPITFNVNDHGFQVIKHKSAVLPPSRNNIDFSDVQQIRDEYWPELRAVIKSELGARCVVCLDSVSRTSSDRPFIDPREKDGRMPILNGKRGPPPSSQPFHVVHNDIHPIGMRNLLRAIKPSFFEENSCAKSVTFEEQQKFFELRDEILDAEKTAIKQSDFADHVQWDGANYEGPRWAQFSI